jgi:hypothetical protein
VEVRQRSQAVRVITGLMIFEVATLDIRHLTILGRQRDGDGQNKLLQIYGSKDNSSYIINCMNFIQVLEVEDMGFMLGRVLLNPV